MFYLGGHVEIAHWLQILLQAIYDLATLKWERSYILFKRLSACTTLILGNILPYYSSFSLSGSHELPIIVKGLFCDLRNHHGNHAI